MVIDMTISKYEEVVPNNKHLTIQLNLGKEIFQLAPFQNPSDKLVSHDHVVYLSVVKPV